MKITVTTEIETNTESGYCGDCRFIAPVQLGNIKTMCLAYLKPLRTMIYRTGSLIMCKECIENQKNKGGVK